MTTVRVNDADPISILSRATASLLPDGTALQWQQLDSRTWTATVGQKTWRLLLLSHDVEKAMLEVRLNGKRLRLQYETPEMRLQKTIGIEPGASQKVTELKAPMPGLIRNINVQPGQTIGKGEPLLVLEAMKMENVIKSPADVTVAQIHIQIGQAVDKNQVLLTFA